jgi:hypothetical protein
MNTRETRSAGRNTALAVDANRDRRPGVPMELDPPRPVGTAHWTEPDRQPDPGNVLKRKGLAALTPVFGNTIAPRGASGLLRRAAYEVPAHRPTHWLLLLLADRLDAIESEPVRLIPLTIALAVGGVGTWVTVRRRQRRRARPFGWLRW